MTLFSEHRLIYRRATDPVRYNSRTAEANAAAQDAVHAKALINNGVQAPTTESGKAAIDRIVQTTQGSQQAESVLQQAGNAGQFQTYTPDRNEYGVDMGGTSTVAPALGQIDQRALKNLMDSGMSEGEARRQIAGNRSNVQQAFNQVGTNSGSTFLSTEQRRLQDRLAQLEAGGDSLPSGVQDPLLQAQLSAANAQEATAIRAQLDQMNRPLSETLPTSVPTESSQPIPKEGTSQEMPANTSPELQQILSMLPPGMESLAPAFRAALEASSTSVGNAGVQRAEAEARAVASADKKDDILTSSADRANARFESAETLLGDTLEKSTRLSATKEENALDELAWQESLAVREATSNLQREMMTMRAEIALGGATKSSNALKTVRETRMAGEQHVLDLKKEFGFKRQDVVATYTEMTVQAHQKFATDWLQEVSRLDDRLSAIELGFITDEDRKTELINEASSDFYATTDKAMERQVTTLEKAGQLVYGALQEERNNKRLAEDSAWDRFKWLRDVYGTNIPPSALDGIREVLTGYDIDALAASPTADELAKRGSGGGGLLSFLPVELRSDGQPLSFDDFIRQKEADAVAAGAYTFDTGKEAMAKYKAEYDAKMAAHSQYDPVQIQTRLQDRIKNLPKHTRENAESIVSQYLSEGRFQEADYYVDGLGAPLSATERGDYIQAMNAKQNVDRIAQKIEELGAMGPVIGRVRSQNPYDDRIVELDNLITQTVPGLARGIFKEVGVLTDQDIDRYKSTIANPNLTLDQARTATKNLLDTINASIQNQIAVHQDSGLNIRDIRSRLEKPSSTAVPTTTADEDYVRSLSF